MKRVLLLLMVALIGLSTSNIVKAQDGLFQIHETSESYRGQGVQWILNQKNETQFYLFGEQHGVQGVAEFVNFIFTSLNEDYEYHLGLEYDRWTTSRLQSDGVDDFLMKYPHSIAFDYDGDIGLVSTALAQQKIQLWGLDQPVTAIHPLNRLAELTQTTEDRRIIRGLYLKSILQMGSYLRRDHFSDLNRIKIILGQNAPEEAIQLIEDLHKSMEIYTTWRAGDQGLMSREISPRIRETLMKDRFDEYLKSNPTDMRAVFKMGGAHTMFGTGPNNVETLGEHVRKVAEGNNMKAVSIGIRRFNPQNEFPDSTHFGDADMLLVDIDSLNTWSESESDSMLIQGFDTQFDAIIYIKDADQASKTLSTQAENRFEHSILLKIVTPIAIILICMIMMGISFSKSMIIEPYHRQHVRLISVLNLAYALIVVYCLYSLMHYTSIESLSLTSTLWLLGPAIAFLIYVIFKLIGSIRRRSPRRIVFIYSLQLVMIAYLHHFVWYWNLDAILTRMW
jgi:hypothetical protein